MKYLLAVCLFLISVNGRSQETFASNTSVESCNDQKDCLTVDHFSNLFYDESRGEFYLKVDFSRFKTEGDTTDNWLNDMVDSLFYFKAIFQKEDFPELSNQNAKTLKLNGRIFYNNIWKDQSVEVTIFTADNAVVPNPGTNFRYDSYKMTFNVPFTPKDFKAYRKLYYNNQTINITVTMGRINLLKPGMEFNLKEVYYQSTR